MENMKPDESRLNNWLSLGFKLGIAVSLTLVIIGLVILFSISGTKNIQPLVRLEQIPAAIVISVGILILLLTPIIQVVVAMALFTKARNKLFIGISVAVFCLAAVSLIIVLI
jgi:uncharacterized membrane protein